MAPEPIAPSAPLLDIRGLDIQFRGARGPIQAVRGLDLQIRRGETLALVGESGCGKSTTALSILRLLAPGATLRGSALATPRHTVWEASWAGDDAIAAVTSAGTGEGTTPRD